MIEVEVHQQLREFLRQQGEPYWPHHLTMARLVARALRLERSALIQAGAPSGYHGRYRLSYLMAALIWSGPVIIVAPEPIQTRLLMVEIPRLRQWISNHKPIQTGGRIPAEEFDGILMMSPQDWLRDRLETRHLPLGVPTILDGADDLTHWAREQLTATIHPQDWDSLMLACPDQTTIIRDIRVQLTRHIFQHPNNPYNCYLVDSFEQDLLRELAQRLQFSPNPPSQIQHHSSSRYLPTNWERFLGNVHAQAHLIWAEIARRQGQFSLYCGPADVATALEPIWLEQPIVLIGGAVDLEPDASIYRQQVGLGELTYLKFSLDRQNELIQLYLPDRLPMPNTPQFQPALLQKMRMLLAASADCEGLTVLLVGDMPLKAQVGAVMASEFGSRVQVEKTCFDENGILVTGWTFWRQHQAVLPTPNLLVIATLPIPSLEDPRVAGRVSHYKRKRQDWFRLYLLPEALSELQRAIAPMRETQGVVALLDNRVNHRSYGHQVLAALSPLARINYLDASIFTAADYPVLD
ncbi:MAG TPA: helicase C-terminal domain-containing protein [Elainellaceae cyanobacterium]